MSGAKPSASAAFIARWVGASGSERANYQLFLTELCALLALPQPDPAREDTRDNGYCFERRVVFQHGDGSQSQGYIDLYRRACYVLEAKRSGLDLDTTGWDKAMLRAQGQAVQYARALPAEQAEAEEELLTRLVALNRERAAEEARGRMRWLRADFQRPGGPRSSRPRRR